MKKINRMSFKEGEKKFCIGTFPDSDGNYKATLSNNEIKETYINNCIHNDEFIQIIGHQIKETKKKINEVNVKSKEYLVLLGSLASLENTLRTFYNTGNVAQLINKGIK